MESANSASRLVEAMGASLQEHGYRATSTTQILAETGISRGSLYFHFPGGKEALATTALLASGGRVTAWINSEFSQASDAVAAACQLIDGFAAGLSATNFRKGCPVALCALEAGEQEPALSEAVRTVYADWQRAIEEGLSSHGVEAGAAAEIAQLALIQIEGALLLARSARSLHPLNVAKTALIRAIGGKP